MVKTRGARRSAAICDIDAQIIGLQKRRKELQEKQATRIGKLAIAAGLADLNVDDDALKDAFATIVTRFRDAEDSAEQPPAGGPAEVGDGQPAGEQQDSAEPADA
ncbi:TraC family protein [Xanthobacter sediminis]|uniref:TraC family protein n=1 Tax=Xanthobacter sediminis TaxID=3119926 RepID=UPI003728AD2B